MKHGERWFPCYNMSGKRVCRHGSWELLAVLSGRREAKRESNHAKPAKTLRQTQSKGLPVQTTLFWQVSSSGIGIGTATVAFGRSSWDWCFPAEFPSLVGDGSRIAVSCRKRASSTGLFCFVFRKQVLQHKCDQCICQGKPKLQSEDHDMPDPGPNWGPRSITLMYLLV